MFHRRAMEPNAPQKINGHAGQRGHDRADQACQDERAAIMYKNGPTPCDLSVFCMFTPGGQGGSQELPAQPNGALPATLNGLPWASFSANALGPSPGVLTRRNVRNVTCTRGRAAEAAISVERTHPISRRAATDRQRRAGENSVEVPRAAAISHRVQREGGRDRFHKRVSALKRSSSDDNLHMIAAGSYGSAAPPKGSSCPP